MEPQGKAMEPQGKQTFYCPHCRQKLSFLDGTIVKMVGRLNATTFSCKTMMYYPGRLGQYGVIVGEGVRIYEGAKIELECINTACKQNFSAPYNDDLAEILMEDEKGNEFKVVFNKIYGKGSTFVLDMQAKKVTKLFMTDSSTPRIINDPCGRSRSTLYRNNTDIRQMCFQPVGALFQCLGMRIYGMDTSQGLVRA